MALRYKYQDFGSAFEAADPPSSFSEEMVEDQKLQSFEEGYQAGWDDAVKAQADDHKRVSVELDQNLQQMSFTYHEAVAKISSTFKPLIEEIVNKILPQVAVKSLGLHLLEQIHQIMEAELDQRITITVSVSEERTIRSLLQKDLQAPFQLETDPMLTSGQAFVQVGQAEREVNLDAVLVTAKAALDGYFFNSEKDLEHG